MGSYVVANRVTCEKRPKFEILREINKSVNLQLTGAQFVDCVCGLIGGLVVSQQIVGAIGVPGAGRGVNACGHLNLCRKGQSNQATQYQLEKNQVQKNFIFTIDISRLKKKNLHIYLMFATYSCAIT